MTTGIGHGWSSGTSPDGSAVTPTNFNDHTITGDVDFASHKITSLSNPSSAQDGATKAYVDLVAPPVVSAAALIYAFRNFR